MDSSAGFVNDPGCFYTGDTRIRFKSDGTMDVWNTSSVGTTLTGPGTPAGTNCGVAANFKPGGSGSNPLAPAAPQNVPVPDDMVIYVKNSATSGACTPGQIVNGSASGSTSTDIIPQGTGASVQGVTDITYNDPDVLTTTTTKTFTRATNTTTPWVNPAATVAQSETGDGHPTTFDCGQGNVYVEGSLHGAVTIAAQNNVIVTNDLTLAATTPPTDASGNVKDATGSDIAGLVASNSVVVYHPVSRSSSSATAITSGTNCSTTIGNVPTSTATSMGTSDKCVWTTTQTYDNQSAGRATPTSPTRARPARRLRGQSMRRSRRCSTASG